MREKYVAKAIEERLFITNLQAKKHDEVNQDEIDQQIKAQARKKLAMETNETYQMFDKMLGLEPNPTIMECKANNPLVNYTKELNERLLNPTYKAPSSLQSSMVKTISTKKVSKELPRLPNRLELKLISRGVNRKFSMLPKTSQMSIDNKIENEESSSDSDSKKSAIDKVEED